jgi:dihydrolipoamide dehydrogenase
MNHDLVVIGGGPAGYVGAIRAAQLGLDAACVECEPALGGTCLRVGCIPSKALLESTERFVEARDDLGAFGVKVADVAFDLAAMMKRKDRIVKGLTGGVDLLLRKNKVARYLGHARLDGPGAVVVEGAGEPVRLEARNVLIATGSRPAMLPGILPGDRVGTSTEALSWPDVPAHLVVIGAGYIGLELGSVWRRLGAKVTVLEFLPRILPGMDAALADLALRVFKRQGLKFQLGVRVTGARADGDGAIVEVDGGEPVRCDRVLVSVGRVPETTGLGLETVGIVPDAKGRIVVGEGYATSAPGVLAVGDVIGGMMLAHKAHEEAVAAVERLVTGFGHVNYDAIPGVVYTEPEIASVGKTEEDLAAAGIAYRKGEFNFRGNGRAHALGHTEGLVKVLADAGTDRILGVHILGPRAGDLIAEAVAAIEFGATSEDLARASHAHPTLSEALMEAALAVDGRGLNA